MLLCPRVPAEPWEQPLPHPQVYSLCARHVVEPPRGGEGGAQSLLSPNPRPLQEFEYGSCSLGWHVSA